MRVSVFGLGYVGCVSAACLAREGHAVIGVDVNRDKVEQVRAATSPIMEPGLDKLMTEVVQSGRLQATCDSSAAVRDSEVSLICVGTPSNSNGSLDLRYVEKVSREIGEALVTRQSYHVVLVRSTVLPGTAAKRIVPALEQSSGKRAGTDFGVCVNPEFLREGTAIEDYYHPSYIVIGELDQRSGEVARQLWSTLNAPLVRTTMETAEMVKYASNAFHALKVVFANEIGNLSKANGIDGREVMDILCRDRQLNVSPAYLKPGFAFGGSCLPKDLRALLHRAKRQDVDCPLLNAVLPSNQRQIQRAVELVVGTGRSAVGILGLSFKAGTDDLRESPIVSLIEMLVGKGYEVRVFDEEVELTGLVGSNKAFVERELPHIASLMRPSIAEVITQAEIVVVAKHSRAFRRVPGLLRKEQVLIDLVGIARDKSATGGGYEGICW